MKGKVLLPLGYPVYHKGYSTMHGGAFINAITSTDRDGPRVANLTRSRDTWDSISTWRHLYLPLHIMHVRASAVTGGSIVTLRGIQEWEENALQTIPTFIPHYLLSSIADHNTWLHFLH